MKTDTLVPMVQFVLDDYDSIMNTEYNDGELTAYCATRWANYAKFLSQKPELWMFVPMKDGKVLEAPENFGKWDVDLEGFEDHKDFAEAKDNCLFEGFVVKHYEMTGDLDFVTKAVKSESCYVFHFKNGKWNPSIGFCSLEHLVNYNLPLTAKAKKLIYG